MLTIGTNTVSGVTVLLSQAVTQEIHAILPDWYSSVARGPYEVVFSAGTPITHITAAIQAVVALGNPFGK